MVDLVLAVVLAVVAVLAGVVVCGGGGVVAFGRGVVVAGAPSFPGGLLEGWSAPHRFVIYQGQRMGEQGAEGKGKKVRGRSG